VPDEADAGGAHRLHLHPGRRPQLINKAVAALAAA
jgi:hypothetical protein